MAVTSAYGFVNDLCLALAHRVEPERLFVILTSYFDESGTHGDAPVTTMAAIMGNVAQWSKFQVEIDRLKKGYGFSIFHTKKFKAKTGEFSGWSNEKCLSLIGELSALTGSRLMHGSVFGISKSVYEERYRGGENPKKLRLDSTYGLCFRVCLGHQIVELDRRLSHHKKFYETRLNVVVESGHKNAGAAARIFDEEKKALGAAGMLLAGITFADKTECDPLMVADFLAHSAYLRGEEGLRAPDTPLPEGPREKTGLTHLSYDAEGMDLLKASIIKKYEARRAYGASGVRPRA